MEPRDSQAATAAARVTHRLTAIRDVAPWVHAIAVEAKRQAWDEVIVALVRSAPAVDPVSETLDQAAPDDYAVYWQSAEGDDAYVGLGVASRVSASGADRFADVARGLRTQRVVVAYLGDAPEVRPRYFGGASFDPRGGKLPLWNGFGVTEFVLHARSFGRASGQGWAMRACRLNGKHDAGAVAASLIAPIDEPKARAGEEHAPSAVIVDTVDDDSAGFRVRVRASLDAIARDEVAKVVVTRAAQVRLRRELDLRASVDALAAAHPRCTTFAFGAPRAAFFGATPERLLYVDGDRVHTMALAGSAPHGTEDTSLRSSKNRREHDVVVQHIRRVLERYCDDVEYPHEPQILRLSHINHLWTPMAATLRDVERAAALLDALHPTPAVAPAPDELHAAAPELCERLERGWYTGLVGWYESATRFDLHVALRSALVRDETVHVFAGAGIVDGSNVDAEFEETETKMKAILSALRERRSDA